MSLTIGGSVCVRNGDDLDYCWRESVRSLLPVCDEVLLCDGESTDGTQEAMRAWAKTEPKIKLCVYPWPNPVGDGNFWVTWLNYARQHLTTDYHLQMDADELLDERSYDEVLRFKKLPKDTERAPWFDRLNFYQDAQHMIPHGVCCGHRVLRLAPATMPMPSDGPHPFGALIGCIAVPSKTLKVFHYGFLRKEAAYFRKARALHGFFFNTYDPRLERAERESKGNWMKVPIMDWHEKLLSYTGPHPSFACQWLKERGYDA